jgi:hypothetical protein
LKALKLNTAIVAFAFVVFSMAAGEIRLSFLQEDQILNDTCDLMKKRGVSVMAVENFQHLVKFHNAGGNGVDTKHFPPSKAGWYEFNSLVDLANRQACEFPRAKGKQTLVCFDVLALLLNGAGLKAEKLYENFEAKEILEVSPDRKKIEPAKMEVFQTGAGLLYPANGYEYFVGCPRSEAETKLGLALRAPRKIRVGETETDEKLRARFAEHVKVLRQDGFEFSGQMQVGMVFYVDAKRGYMKSDHAFLCFKSGKTLTTVEKTSPTGPFIRGEFEDPNDLAAYASTAERTDSNNPEDSDYGETVITTLNDEVIGIFRPKK